MDKEHTQVSDSLTDTEEEFSLWLREPESAELDREIISGHLCSCDDVCIAVVDESI